MPPLPVGPMLATAGTPPTGPGWTVEAKWDGARSLSRLHAGNVDLVSRPGNNLATRFPDVTSALRTALGGRTAILDGEIVSLGSGGRPDFARLQRRLRVPHPTRTLRESVPAKYLLFDCIFLDGVDLSRRPYVERRAALDSLGLGRDGSIVIPPCWPDLDGQILLDTVTDMRLEGVVFKRAASTYQAGRRSRAWVKTVVRREARLVVIGWVSGRTDPLGALLVAGHDPHGNLIYCGTVTSGLSRASKQILFEKLQPLESPSPAVACPPATLLDSHVRWSRPQLVGLVEYREFPGRLRHPSWKGLLTSADPATALLPA